MHVTHLNTDKIARAHEKVRNDRAAEPISSTNFADPVRILEYIGIHPGMKVADFGAGSGAYMHALASGVTETGRVFAIDVQRDLLRRIKNDVEAKGHHNVDIMWANVEEAGGTKIKDHLLDLVLISNILFQVPNKLGMLKEAKRILKPSGKLLIVDWTDSFRGMGPQKKDVVTKERAQELAHEAGFIFTHTAPAGSHHYGLVFKV